MNARITALILAAGKSSRMGDQNKLLLPFKAGTILSYVFDEISKSNCDNALIVTGNEADKIKNMISGNAQIIHNTDFADGLSTSIKKGVLVLSDECDGVMICLGDMPYITTNEYNKLIEKFENDKIIIPVSKGKMGNPLIFSKQYFDELMRLSGDKGARSLLQKYTDKIIRVEMHSDVIFKDIDTFEEYQDS